MMRKLLVFATTIVGIVAVLLSPLSVYAVNEPTQLLISGAGGSSDGRNLSPAISSNGRFIVFDTSAPLVTEDTNNLEDVYLFDRINSTFERISVSTNGTQTTTPTCSFGDSYGARVTPDGRFVVFTSGAENLVTDDTNQSIDVFVRDRQLRTTVRVSVESNGQQIPGNQPCQGQGAIRPSISDNGQFVSFQINNASMIPEPYRTNSFLGYQIFVRDRVNQMTEWISTDSSGTPGPTVSRFHLYEAGVASLSEDGRYVSFESNQILASNVTEYSSGSAFVYIKDRLTNSTELISKNLANPRGERHICHDKC
jgi:hypothetical protein